MNKIIYARREKISGERTAKNFEILVPEKNCEIDVPVLKGQAVIIPQLKRYRADFDGIIISFDTALLPFDDVSVICDNEESAIAFNAGQAVRYFGGAAARKDVILSELGNLLIGYIIAFASKKEFSPVVELVRSEIAKGVSDCSFSLKDCLRKMPLNYDYIRKLFKKETGATPYEYLLRERMTLAQQLLTSGISNKFSSYTVSQISEACGYSEPLYFSRVFRQYFGVSPSEYK